MLNPIFCKLHLAGHNNQIFSQALLKSLIKSWVLVFVNEGADQTCLGQNLIFRTLLKREISHSLEQ